MYKNIIIAWIRTTSINNICVYCATAKVVPLNVVTDNNNFVQIEYETTESIPEISLTTSTGSSSNNLIELSLLYRISKAIKSGVIVRYP